MAHDNALVKKIQQNDRLVTLALEEYGEDGVVKSEEVVAYGDGEALPYRTTIKKSAFELAAPWALVSPESTITALDSRRLAGLSGAMLARQSRASGTVIDVLVNEFLVSTPEESEKLGVPMGELKTKKLDEIIERILVQYGDDSVQELETATVLFNSVSNLASKIIEDRRLGSFIEQSSRYVVYSDRDPVTGKYAYYREPAIMASEHGAEYERVLDRAFVLYSRLVDMLTGYYSTVKPLAEAEYAVRPGDKSLYRLDVLTDEKEIKEFRRVYKFDLKTRACDTARIVLPAATLTNLAMVANGRTYEHLLKRLYSSDVGEFKDIAGRLHETLNKLIPKYVKRANTEGEKDMRAAERIAKQHVAKNFPEFLIAEQSLNEVVPLEIPQIIQAGAEPMVHILAASYFPYVSVSYASMVKRLKEEPEERILGLLEEFFAERSSRRDRASRAWEHGQPCTFEIVGNFGIFRDLHRHRILTQQRQLLCPNLGFTLPEDIKAIGMAGEVWALVAEVQNIHKKLARDISPEIAQYCVLFGHHIRFMMGFSLREAQHFLELRTVPQGHPDYRRVCQKMATSIFEKAPWVRSIHILKFVDYQDYPWARAAAEARQSQKLLEKGLV